MPPLRRRLLLPRLIAAAVLQSLALAVLASAGDEPAPNAFVPESYVPEPERADFAAGRLGVVPGSHWRVYQLLAWRALHGQPLPRGGLPLLAIRNDQAGPEGNAAGQSWNDDRNGVTDWLAARRSVAPPLPDNAKPGVERYLPQGLFSHLNCHAEAFATAARTLRERVQQRGEAGARLWLQGQDAVFANCAPVYRKASDGQLLSSPTTLPPPPAADAPDWLKRDRAYQQAAALFYAARYDEARSAFLAIGADKASPWQPLGAYLATRCLLRQATLMPVPGQDSGRLAPDARPLLEQARRELQAQAATLPAAGQLIGWVEARLNPQQRASELARALATGPLVSPQRVRQLADYLALLDKLARNADLAEQPEPLTAWIAAMQQADQAAADPQKRGPALARLHRRWQADADPAWLMPLAATASSLAELPAPALAAMKALPRNHLAWHTVHWHLARLTIADGRAADADTLVDAALQSDTDPLRVSSRNLWLRLKLVTARSLPAFLAAAPRQVADLPAPAAAPSPGTAMSPAASAASAPASAPGGAGNPPWGIDTDLMPRLYRHFPLSQLAALAATGDSRPPDWRQTMVPAVFARALVLEDWGTADRLADAVAAPRATTRHLYQRLRAATTPNAKRLAAALILVNTPELHPETTTAGGRAVYFGCGVQSETGPASPLFASPPLLLSAEERVAAEREAARLNALPIRSQWLGATLLKWAATRPDDPEAPKALHFLVASTRLECPEAWYAAPSPSSPVPPASPQVSRDAFQLLHRLWPNSEWAARTRYWFAPPRN